MHKHGPTKQFTTVVYNETMFAPTTQVILWQQSQLQAQLQSYNSTVQQK